MFDFLQKKGYQKDDQVVSDLMKITSMGFGTDQDFAKDNMLTVLDKAITYSQDSNNPQLFYWIGVAWRNFTAWHVRGDARKEYLNKAVSFFEQAYKLSKDTLPIQLPPENRHCAGYLDQIDIAGEIGHMLVDDAPIRDLERAEHYLLFVYENTSEYEPYLCSYADLFYKRGEYLKSAKLGLELHERCLNSTEWKDDPPPAPMGIAGSGYRAHFKKLKKEGKIKEAIEVIERMHDLGITSENDIKILGRLKS